MSPAPLISFPQLRESIASTARTAASHHARREWLATAGAMGDHRSACVYCQHGQDCPAYVALDTQERDAWTAFESARRGER